MDDISQLRLKLVPILNYVNSLEIEGLLSLSREQRAYYFNQIYDLLAKIDEQKVTGSSQSNSEERLSLKFSHEPESTASPATLDNNSNPDFPEEVVAELSKSHKSSSLSEKIQDILKGKPSGADLDGIIIALWENHRLKVSRDSLRAKLNRMKRAKEIDSEAKGVFKPAKSNVATLVTSK